MVGVSTDAHPPIPTLKVRYNLSLEVIIMPRARNIKPGFFENEHLGVLSSDARLLFASLWTLANRQGVVECRVAKIRTYAFRYNTNITDKDVNRELTVLTRLDKGRMLSRVMHDSEEYLLVHNFIKHASPHHTEKRGGLPDFAFLKTLIIKEELPLTVNSPLDLRENPPESLILNPESPILNTESNPRAIIRKSPMDLIVKEKGFEEFWNKYGIKKDRKKCEVLYNRVVKSGVSHDLIMRGLDGYQQECIKSQVERQFIKRPLTWLNGSCWNDEYDRELTREEKLREIEDVINAKQNNLQITGEAQ